MKATNNFINEISISYSKKLFTTNTIKSSTDANSIAQEIYVNTQSQIELKEYFFMIMLNRGNNVIGYLKLSEGGITGTLVDSRLAFAAALKGLATGIILVHNHPSGSLNPSEPDIKLTNKFKKIGELLDIAILDHLIITNTSYYSFADSGML